MTDAEIDKLYNDKIAKVKSAEGYDDISDEEVDRLYEEQVRAKYGEPSFIGELGKDAMEVLDVVDAYTGAPTRQAIKTFGESKSPLEAGKAFYRQFGEDTATAPTGIEAGRALGVRDVKTLGGAYAEGSTPQEIQQSLQEMPEEEQIAPAKVPLEAMAGTAIEFIDPLMVIPPVKTGKFALRTGGKIARKMGKVAMESSDLGTATKKLAERGIESGERVIESITSNLRKTLKPERVKDWPRLRNILEENDLMKSIDDVPEGLEFGEHSQIGTSAKVVREGPYGQKKMDKFQSFLNDVDSKTRVKINKISTTGATMDTLEAGRHLVDSYNNGVKRFFDTMETTYQNISALVPDVKISDESITGFYNTLIRGINKADNLAKRGIGNQPSRARQLLKDLETIANVNGNYDDFVGVMKNVGKEAFSSVKVMDEVPVDKKVLREIYFDMRDIIYKEVSKIDPNVAKSLKESNKKFSKFFNEQSAIGKIIARGGSGENLFKRVIMNGNADDVKALRAMLTESEMNEVRASMLNELLSINKDIGRINFNQSTKALSNKRHVVAELFEGHEDQLREVVELLEIGSRAGDAVLNFSGTSRSQRFVNWLKELASSGVEEEAIEVGKKLARKRTDANRLKRLRAKKGIKPKPKNVTTLDDIARGVSGARGLKNVMQSTER